ncbi:hypothetical protein SteCoe_16399 [Stentor coeruleus]|uniref:Uncharacterized protein n=1 Tax=Stentor coeruleus TaxID=5963 RepID=A0A1R2C1A2_9CILI|nr:hypothetical protein SteCoe_16399 [Stentor coeruleus]
MLTDAKKSFKLVIFGDPAVGKSSIMYQFIYNSFSSKYSPTINFNPDKANIRINNKLFLLKFLDTPNYNICQTSTKTFKKADFCILVYDITKMTTFESLSIWKDMFLNKYKQRTRNFPFLVLGNKADKMALREVDTAKAMKWCRDNGNMMFCEVSAGENFNIEKPFQDIVKKTIMDQKVDRDYMRDVNLRLRSHIKKAKE